MNHEGWMLYGATGYSGALIAEEAVRRGHRPVLAGRSEDKLRPLAARLDLPFRAFSLEDGAGIRRALEDVPLVLHAAGPFVHTAEPMRDACLEVGAHYLDITGEIPVFRASFARDREARERGIVLLSGVGFDVVPTDCLARYVADKVGGTPRALEIAFAAIGQASAGTMKSALEGLPHGGWVRRGGHLVPWRIGRGARTLRFDDKERLAVPIPWGDLETAFHSTGAQDITTYMSVPRAQARVQMLAGPLLPHVLKLKPLRSLAQRLIERRVTGPDEAARARGRSHVWARATDAQGRTAEAWLSTLEGYAFTARAAVLCAEKTLEAKGALKGALTPSRAFGPDLVLQIDDTRRFDALD